MNIIQLTILFFLVFMFILYLEKSPETKDMLKQTEYIIKYINHRKTLIYCEESSFYNKFFKNKYNLTAIKRQRAELISSIALSTALTTSVIASILYKKNKQKTADINNAKDTINQLISESNKSNELLRKKLVEELDLTKKTAYIHSIDIDKSNKFIKEYESLFRRKMKETLDWNNLYQLIDALYPRFRVKLEKELPRLSEKEKQLCYLIRADFKTAEIAYILNYNHESVDSMKYKLRKKTGFNSMSKFGDFLKKT